MDARAAGSRTLSIADPSIGVTFPAWVLYPTRAPASPVSFGPYSLDVAVDAPIDDGRFPVVVLSHGSGSSPYLFRTLAAHLAKNGFVVALPEHPGNNRKDDALAHSDENLVRRPRHVRLVLDAIERDDRLAPHAAPDRAAILGHSIGAYTALAVAGGKPWTQRGERVEVEADPRVSALVLFAPATPWYAPEGSLADVTAPILVYSGAEDAISPAWNAQLVLDGVPDRSQVVHRVIERAGHYSFFAPFPEAMRRPGFAPAIDPEGFDREAFQATLEAEVLAFLARTIGLEP